MECGYVTSAASRMAMAVSRSEEARERAVEERGASTGVAAKVAGAREAARVVATTGAVLAV